MLSAHRRAQSTKSCERPVSKDVIAWWPGEDVDPRCRLGRRDIGAVGAIGGLTQRLSAAYQSS